MESLIQEEKTTIHQCSGDDRLYIPEIMGKKKRPIVGYGRIVLLKLEIQDDPQLVKMTYRMDRKNKTPVIRNAVVPKDLTVYKRVA